MNGGTITEVSGDGIYLDSGATLVMNGGAIRNCGDNGVETTNANFTMNGGEITGSENDGLYIYQSNFTMNGGEISGNYRYDLYFDSNEFHLSGGTVGDAIYLTNNTRIIIDSELDPDACFPILMETNGKFTSGLNGKGDVSNFRSAEECYTVALNEQGEAMLVQSGTVVPYVERSWDGEKIVSKKTTRNNGQWQPFPENANITSGWYYLDRDVTKNGRVESITGDVNLILGDGHTLDVKGLYVPAGSTLTIYGQSDGENAGKICSRPGKSQGGAGIGGEGGTAYIGGGSLKVILPDRSYNCDAIGRGHEDSVSGTVYIAAGNNETGKNLRVDYKEPGKVWKTAKASDRTKCCHNTNNMMLGSKGPS